MFFIGLAEWMWTIHHGVAGIVIAGLVVGASFFLITTLISVIYVDAPFRTPTSRLLPRLFAGLYNSLVYAVSWKWVTDVALLAKRSTIGCLIYTKRLWERRGAFSVQSLFTSCLPKPSYMSKPFEVREQKQIQSIPDMGRTALLWLVNSVDVVPHTANQFRCVIQQMLLLPSSQLVDPCIERAPWEAIFSELFKPHLQRPRSEAFSEQEEEKLMPILHAFNIFWSIPPRNKNFEWVMQRASHSANNIISFPALFALWQDAATRPTDGSRETLLASVVAQAGSLPSHILVSLLSRLYQWQRTARELEASRSNIRVDLPAKPHGKDLVDFVDALSADLDSLIPSITLPLSAIDVLFDILALRLLGVVPPGDTPLDRYSISVEKVFREAQYAYNRSATEEIHDAIVSQILGKLLPEDSPNGERDGRAHLLRVLHRLLCAKPLSITQTSGVRAFLTVIQRDEPWSQANRLQTARIYALVLPEPYEFNGDDWGEWRTRFYLGLDKMLHQREWASAASQNLIWEQAELETGLSGQKVNLLECHIDRLCAIRDPILSIYASGGSRTPSIHPLSLPVVIGAAKRQAWETALTWWSRSAIGWQLEGFYFHSSHLPFVNAIIPTWAQGIDRLARSLMFVETVDGNTIVSQHYMPHQQTKPTPTA
jgi:hypothetical protein